MKAIVITSPGGPEVLQLQEVDEPELKDDEVLIKVEASGLNQADTVQRSGAYPPPKGASHYLGVECSGTIQALGKSVSRWKIGDQVCYFHLPCSFYEFLLSLGMRRKNGILGLLILVGQSLAPLISSFFFQSIMCRFIKLYMSII